MNSHGVKERMQVPTNGARFLLLVVTMCLTLLITACSGTSASPDLAILYNRSAQVHAPDRNPIIAIPGILGSRLKDQPTGTIVWGAFDPSSASPGTSKGARMIALPIDKDKALVDLRDNVVPDGVLEKVRLHMFGVPVDIQAYAGILSTLGAGDALPTPELATVDPQNGSVKIVGQNSGVLPNKRDSRNAIMGVMDLRSLRISLIVWRDTFIASANAVVVKP